MGRRRSFDHDAIVKLYLKGHTPREVAARIGCHPDYASKVVRASGQSRPPGRPKYRWVCADCGSTNVIREIVQ